MSSSPSISRQRVYSSISNGALIPAAPAAPAAPPALSALAAPAQLRPVLVENFATTAGLGFHAAGRYSLISPANLARSWIRAAGTGKAMTSGASSGAQGHAMALVAAAGVVVADVVGQDHAQVLLASDEHPVGALGPYRAREALGIGVHPGRLGRDRQCPDSD